MYKSALNPCFRYYRICLPLHLIFIECSKVPFPNLHLSGIKVFPATLKILSTGADVAGIDRHSIASLLIDGFFRELEVYQNASKH